MEVRIAKICIHFFQQNMPVFVVVIGIHSDDDDGCVVVTKIKTFTFMF